MQKITNYTDYERYLNYFKEHYGDSKKKTKHANMFFVEMMFTNNLVQFTKEDLKNIIITRNDRRIKKEENPKNIN